MNIIKKNISPMLSSVPNAFPPVGAIIDRPFFLRWMRANNVRPYIRSNRILSNKIIQFLRIGFYIHYSLLIFH